MSPADLDPVAVRGRILALLREQGRDAGDAWPGDRPLELGSLEVVLLHERLEQVFGIRVPARQVNDRTFGTLDGLCNLVLSDRRTP